MPTRNFNANKSSLFAKTGSTELGGGQDDHLPVGGSWNGYTFRSAVRFATDWSGMKNIQSAVLWLKTSSAVHLAFSSDPDILIARATGDWTANSASSSSEGGSGWSTAATNYPGPGITTSGQVSKDVTTAESTWISVDISTIVRAWAPGSVVGGGGAANYGILLYGAATGDLTEFNSYTSTTKPYIVVTYTTDSPPVATMDGPTGAVGSVRPTFTGSVSDPDGDATENVHLEVQNAALAVVYQADLGAVASPWSHVPTADLPGGPLTARAVAQAGGLAGGWSNQVAFTVDRPPVMGAFTSPPASSSNRRPAFTFTYSDPDGNVADWANVQVYATVGGVATGAPVWEYSQGGTYPSPVTVTPAVDLPGGPLVARAQVRSGPAFLWSGFGADYPFLIALTSPTVTYYAPATPGEYVAMDGTLQDLNTAFGNMTHAHGVNILPPSGQTLTRLRIWVGYGLNLDPSLPGNGTLVYDAAPAPGGGNVGWGTTLGTSGAVVFSSAFEVTASGGGVTKVWRTGRCAAIEYVGRVRLGDGVSGLGGSIHGLHVAPVANWVRAENAGGAALSGWTTYSEAQKALPAVEAWLGLRARASFVSPVDGNICVDGTAEMYPDAYTTLPTGWYKNSGTGTFGTGNFSHVGSRSFNGRGPITVVGDGHIYEQPVIGGAWYRLSAWAFREGWADGNVNIWVGLYGDAGWLGDAQAAGGLLTWALGSRPADTWVFKESLVRIPSNAKWVTFVQAFTGGSDWVDDLSLKGPVTGSTGLDKWDLAWNSLG